MKFRYLFYQLVKNDFLSRYYSSYISFLWPLLNSLLYFAMYYFIFKYIFVVKGVGTEVSYERLFLGLAVVLLTIDIINKSSTIFLSNIQYVKKITIPIELLCYSTVIASFLTFVINILLILFYSIFFSNDFNVLNYLLSFFILSIPLILFLTSLSLLIALIGAFFKDIQLIINFFSGILIFISPVFFEKSNFPKNIEFLLDVNPLTYFVINFKNALNSNFNIDIICFLYYSVFYLLILIISVLIFKKVCRYSSDYL